MAEALRCFLALSPDVASTATVETALTELRRARPEWRWQTTEQLHLTLAFLGDVPATTVPALTDMLERRLGDWPQIPLNFTRLLTLPPGSHATALVLGTDATPADLQVLWRRVNDLLREFDQGHPLAGYRPPPSFLPHLTVARGRGRDPVRLDATTRARPLHIPVRFTEVHLFQSDLTPRGSVYSRLFTRHLGRGDTIPEKP